MKNTNQETKSQSLVNLQLDMSLFEKLNQILWDHQDEGPTDAGWASSKLKELRYLTDKALEDAKTK